MELLKTAMHHWLQQVVLVTDYSPNTQGVLEAVLSTGDVEACAVFPEETASGIRMCVFVRQDRIRRLSGAAIC